MKNLISALILLLTVLSTTPLYGDALKEEILSYDSTIIVVTNDSLIVTERIKVRAMGGEIKRGIYRDFPIIYQTKEGFSRRTPFKVLSVHRDGKVESYHTQIDGGNIRVYIGEKNKYLEQGIYTYTLRYITSRHLIFGSNYTELYWNVTGNFWAFPIRSASAKVILPPGVGESVSLLEGYTGSRGSKDTNCVLNHTMDTVTASTTTPLKRGEGLTIRLQFGSAQFTPPTSEEIMLRIAEDNKATITAIGGLIIVMLYFFIAWLAVGRDPAKGVIVTEYFPPEKLSPQAMRFIRRMDYDQRVFTSAIIHMAVVGYLEIDEEEDGKFRLKRVAHDYKLLNASEEAIAKKLFSPERESIELSSTNHSEFSSAISAFKKSLEHEYEDANFKSNIKFFVPGLILSIAVFIATIVLEFQNGIVGFLLLWLTGWSFGLFMILKTAIQYWSKAMSSPKSRGVSFFTAIFLTIFALPFLAAEIFVILFGLTMVQNIFSLSVMVSLIGLNFLFAFLIKAPTLAGRALMDKIEGFRRYLDITEKKAIEVMNPPDKTPAVFEMFLPYAIAFDMENNWGKYFEGELAIGENRDYSPSWYHSSSLSTFSMSSFSSSLGSSFSTSLGSSASAPSSSSGGGGFSGGGSGGGGGGGW